MNRQFNLLCISVLYILRLTSVGITDCKPFGPDVGLVVSSCFIDNILNLWHINVPLTS